MLSRKAQNCLSKSAVSRIISANASRNASSSANPFENQCLKETPHGKVYDFNALKDERIKTLPISIRVLLESVVRNCDNLAVLERDVETILDWSNSTKSQKEIPFLPARVLLQDFTGVPAVADLAAMRDAMVRLGKDPKKINPLVPVDLVIDHSIQVDSARTPESLLQNEKLEFQRNSERFQFLKWGSSAFDGLRIVPPGSGIVHQVNLEYLAHVIYKNKKSNLLYPDSVVGTDSHTTMIDGLGVVGWGVGGIEAEAVMLGQPISMVLPEVIGFELVGKLPQNATATDLVLTCTQMLRKKGVVGKFVEFFGNGVSTLSLADRATIANMAPEYGATMGYFPVDNKTIEYLKQTGRSEKQIQQVNDITKLLQLYTSNGVNNAQFTDVITLDLSKVQPCISGPKRPQDRIILSDVKKDFEICMNNPNGFKGFGLTDEKKKNSATIKVNDKEYKLNHGSVVIAAITSCTNTSNPNVIIAAALLAKNAVEKGLTVPEYIKTSLSPGSKAVTEYLKASKLDKSLEKLGFYHAGYGCMTCIGNSGELSPEITQAIIEKDLVVSAVLSGNRNFEGRVHPYVKAAYLASPPLVVAYALAGRMDIDFTKEAIGKDKNGNDVFLNDIWPSLDDVAQVVNDSMNGEMFKKVYDEISKGTTMWNSLEIKKSDLFNWNSSSTYIHHPPFFKETTLQLPKIESIKDAYCLLNLGDSITTDHISPAGDIASNSPAAKYLEERGLKKKDFNTYGSRRGNDEVMVRGTFANIRLVNKLIKKLGPYTLHIPSNMTLPIYDVSSLYLQNNTPTIILAGKEYGSGSSRDWAAKGPYLQGVKVVIAQSYERIHRSNLIGMGVLPLQFKENESAESLGLTGMEVFNINLNNNNVKAGEEITVTTNCGKKFNVVSRIDTIVEEEYYRHGGILQYTLRRLAK